MKTIAENINQIYKSTNTGSAGKDFFDYLRKEGWTYIKNVVDIVREPILILDKDFRVMAANEPFYRTFQVDSKDTENKIIYKLGNGQWNIPALRKLLEDILPEDMFFKGFEVSHNFPGIGNKTMILNARHIYFRNNTDKKLFPPIILLAIEDITEMMAVAETLANHTKQLDASLTEQTQKMKFQIEKLETEIIELKSRL